MNRIMGIAAALIAASVILPLPLPEAAAPAAEAAITSAGAITGHIANSAQQVRLTDPPTEPLTKRFDQAVAQWIDQLSAEPEFADWPKADRNREPLGPGMHGWIVLLTLGGAEIGYLVVTVDPDGAFQLAEYGSGEYPLFSPQVLYQSLVRQALIPDSFTYERFMTDSAILKENHYYSPLHQVWAVTIEGDDYWLDGKSGELLPLTRQLLESMNERELADNAQTDYTHTATVHSTIAHTSTLPAYDPFYDLSWLRKPELKLKDLHTLQALLDQKQKLTYVTDLYEDTILLALPVTGYQEWSDGAPYLRLDQLGSRYIPAAALMRMGKFYSSKGDADNQMPSPSYS